MYVNFTKHYNQLTEGQAERLALAMEEMGESIQMIGKVLRHGYEEYSPFDPTKTTNREDLEKELGHVLFAMSLLCKWGDLDTAAIERSAAAKSVAVGKYLHHQ